MGVTYVTGLKQKNTIKLCRKIVWSKEISYFTNVENQPFKKKKNIDELNFVLKNLKQVRFDSSTSRVAFSTLNFVTLRFCRLKMVCGCIPTISVRYSAIYNYQSIKCTVFLRYRLFSSRKQKCAVFGCNQNRYVYYCLWAKMFLEPVADPSFDEGLGQVSGKRVVRLFTLIRHCFRGYRKPEARRHRGRFRLSGEGWGANSCRWCTVVVEVQDVTTEPDGVQPSTVISQRCAAMEHGHTGTRTRPSILRS